MAAKAKQPKRQPPKKAAAKPAAKKPTKPAAKVPAKPKSKRQPPRPASLANLPPGLKKYWASQGVK